MAELNNIPEADDTKTRVTSKITPETPGKSAEPIDLDAPKPDSSTMTRRTLKLQGLAGLAGAPKAEEKPAHAPAPAPEKESAKEDDTRTRRTLKLSSLANGPSVKAPSIGKSANKPAAPALDKPSGEKLSLKSASSETVTRRTQRLEALDTQDVVAMTEADLNASTVKMSKPAAPVNNPLPPVPKTRQTVKVEGIAPAHTPVIDLDAKVGDTNTRKTVKLTAPEAAPADIDLDAVVGDDTRTRKSIPAQAPEKLKSDNVDDTVKLQRPAPKPAMPGSVAPAAQGAKSAVGGVRLNKPATPKAAPKAPAASAAPAAPKAPQTAAPEPAPAAAPQAAPKREKKEKLKVNTDALKDLGSAPMTQDAMPPVNAMMPEYMMGEDDTPKESLVGNILFIFFGVLAMLLLIFVTAMAVIDHANIWTKDAGSQKITLPLVSDYAQKVESSVDEKQVVKLEVIKTAKTGK